MDEANIRTERRAEKLRTFVLVKWELERVKRHANGGGVLGQSDRFGASVWCVTCQ